MFRHAFKPCLGPSHLNLILRSGTFSSKAINSLYSISVHQYVSSRLLHVPHRLKMELRENVYTIPNAMSLGRLLSAPLLGYWIVTHQPGPAFALFSLSSLTDMVRTKVLQRFVSIHALSNKPVNQNISLMFRLIIEYVFLITVG